MVVVAADIEIHATAEPVRAQQGVDHADQFGALVVDGRGIEIVDPQIALRPHRVGERAVVLRKLRGPQCAHLGDPAHRRAPLIGRELLIAENGQPLLQRQLKPVATGHPVAGPVVEIFVSDHRLDVLEVGIGRGFRLGQHITRVKNIETFVLHCSHIEVADRDDIENVEVVFEAEHVFVPAHRLFQRRHCMAAFILVTAPHPDGECHALARARREPVANSDEIAGDEREEVRRLGVRIDPFRPVPAVPGLACPGRIAVRQQDREAGLVGGDGRRIARHHIRPVDEISDPAEALGLALGTEIAARHVEAAERGVPLGPDPGLEVEGEMVWDIGQFEPASRGRAPAVLSERLAIERQRDEFEHVAVEPERCGAIVGHGVAAQPQPRFDPRLGIAEVENEVDRVDQKIGGPVVGEPHRQGRREIGHGVGHRAGPRSRG